MSETTLQTRITTPAIIAIAVSVVVLFAPVLAKLGIDLWNDENYSHGLLVPFVIAFILWREKERVAKLVFAPAKAIGVVAIVAAILMLLAGTVGAELFTQRVALIGALIGITLYLAGWRWLIVLATPLVLLLLSIPIPQILFNRISFPLQLWASQIAVWVIRLLEVPTLRKGNIIDILPRGATQTISLEVVEACSGIRSLMTLVVLGLVLGYFTRTDENGDLRFGMFSGRDVLRTFILMISAVPIAMVTNAGRVAATGVGAYYYGISATEGLAHDISGMLVFVVALALLLGLNLILKRILSRRPSKPSEFSTVAAKPVPSIVPIVVLILVGAAAVNWFALRPELSPDRQLLKGIPAKLGDWSQHGDEIPFDEGVQAVVRTTDHTMRQYSLPDGRIGDIYVGYYATQRTGATYHSPQNCLPGAGWVLGEPQYVEITRGDGTTFTANLYIIENGIYKQIMIYWYQGRGRVEASEYRDKLGTVIDSVTRRRSDGALLRVMTPVGHDEKESLAAGTDLASKLADQLGPFIPE